MRSFIYNIRASKKNASIYKIISISVSAILSLFWARVLVREMGVMYYGMFITFIAITRFGGLGDLGVGGAVSLRTSQFIGRGEMDELGKFLDTARAFFFTMSIVLAIGFVALSPILTKLLNDNVSAKYGSWYLLFVLGGIGVALLILDSYFQNLNYGIENITWPIFSAFIVAQVGPLGQYLFLKLSFPFWAQYIPYITGLFISVSFSWFFVNTTNKNLSRLLPLRFSMKEWMLLLQTGFWITISYLGNLIFVSSDRIIINAVFGSARVPAYVFNYKMVEMAILAISTFMYVSLPKLTMHFAAIKNGKDRMINELVIKINGYQIISSALAVTVYCFINNVFITKWVGNSFRVSNLLQYAFAVNLFITLGGGAFIQAAGKIEDFGLRLAGYSIAGTAFINLILSVIAARLGFIEGIAFATVFAQIILSYILGRYVVKKLKISFSFWFHRAILIPIIYTSILFFLKSIDIALSIIAALIMFVVIKKLLNVQIYEIVKRLKFL